MYLIVSRTQDENGRYSWSSTDNAKIVDILNKKTSVIADESYLPLLEEYMGFVNIEFTEDGVASMTANQEAYDAYMAENIEPEEVEPPAGELTVWDELDAAYQEGVNSV